MRASGKNVFLVVLTIVLNCQFSHGQVKTDEYPNQLKVSPMRFVDLVAPGIDVAYERKYSQRSTQVSVGWIREFINTTPFLDLNGVRLSLEQKFFIDKPSDFNFYFAVEPVFMKARFSTSAEFQDAQTGLFYADSFKVSRNLFSLHAKYGLQAYIGRFVMDMSAGFGLRYVSTLRSDLLNKDAFESGPRHPNVYFFVTKQQNVVIPVIPITFRVGYRF